MKTMRISHTQTVNTTTRLTNMVPEQHIEEDEDEDDDYEFGDDVPEDFIC